MAAERRTMRMIDRYLNLFSLGFLGVLLSLFLVLFMATPMVCGLGPAADVPWAASATVLVETERDLVIHVKKDGQVFVGSRWVPQSLLRRELGELATQTGTDRHVLVRADGAVPFAIVQDILAASRAAGYTEFSLVTFRGTRLEAWQKGGAV